MMLARFVETRIAAAERAIGVKQDWLRDLYRCSPRLFRKFLRFLPLAAYRKAASKEALAVARLIGSRSQDCGSCVQITVNLALSEGVDPSILRAVLDDRPQDLRPDLAEVMGYAQAVVDRSADVIERIETLQRTIGEAAVCELALAIASALLFPVAKRGMGHAVSCASVTLELPSAGGAPVGEAIHA